MTDIDLTAVWKEAFPQRSLTGEIGGPDCRYCAGAGRVWYEASEDSDGNPTKAGFRLCACRWPVPRGTKFK